MLRKRASAPLPSWEQVPRCWLLLNIIHCAICSSVNETVISAMLPNISVEIHFTTFPEFFRQVANLSQSKWETVNLCCHVCVSCSRSCFIVSAVRFGLKYRVEVSSPSGCTHAPRSGHRWANVSGLPTADSCDSFLHLPNGKFLLFFFKFKMLMIFTLKINSLTSFLEAHLPSIWPLYASAHHYPAGFSQHYNLKQSTVITTLAPN